MIRVKKYQNPFGPIMPKGWESVNMNTLRRILTGRPFFVPQIELPEVNIFPSNDNYDKRNFQKLFKGLVHVIHQKIKGYDFKPEIIDFNGRKVSLIDINSKKNQSNPYPIVGNYFIETKNPNMVGTPKSFYEGQKLGDNNTPIENFHTWMGFEDGRLKVYPFRDQFKEDTLITPVRNKNRPIIGPIDQSYDFGTVRDNFIIYQGNGKNARKILVPRQDRIKAINDYVNTYAVNNNDPAYLIQLDGGRYSHNSAPVEDYGYDLARDGNIWGIEIR